MGNGRLNTSHMLGSVDVYKFSHVKISYNIFMSKLCVYFSFSQVLEHFQCNTLGLDLILNFLVLEQAYMKGLRSYF